MKTKTPSPESSHSSSKAAKKGGKQMPAPAPRAGWRGWIAFGLVALFVLEFANALRPPKDKTFAISQFAQLPLIFNGRVQPMDSLGHNSLLQIRNTTTVPLEGNAADGTWGEWSALAGKGQLSERNWYQFSKHPKKLKQTEWLLELMSAPDRADERYIFAANHPDLVSLLKLEGKGVEKSGLHYYSFNEVKDTVETLRTEAQRASKLDSTQRSPFDRAVLQLQNSFFLYMRLKNTIQPQNSADFTKELDEYLAVIKPGRDAAIAQQAGQKHDEASLNRLMRLVEKYDVMNALEPPLVVPPHGDHAEWERTGHALMDVARGGPLLDSVRLYATIATAYRTGDVPRFNEATADLRKHLEAKGFGAEIKKGQREFFFNRMLAFKRTMYMYLTAFLLVLAYWFNFTDVWRRGAFWLVCLALVIHSAGLIFRMVLEGRPPVTNLYSSAIFIGWGSVILGLVLERFHRNGIGLAVGSAVGFVTLIIAHNLALGGDTMEMMQAVLDTNFWLATHVVVITLGYASTFVAGFLALIYVLRGVFTTTLDRVTAKSLSRMVYGIVCFATLFSFVGTVLGGIWADQSWGRFWGWDPKENGALIIVLWNALILHARWGGLVKERGLMNLVIFGNVVTAWSWFGVNMLGIGLHSYGFMAAAFLWLMIFVGSQLLVMLLGGLPLRFWRSPLAEGDKERPDKTDKTGKPGRPAEPLPA
jgi:ABC-type transport system involved in cytochrome c biogenesis permease subunit